MSHVAPDSSSELDALNVERAQFLPLPVRRGLYLLALTPIAGVRPHLIYATMAE